MQKSLRVGTIFMRAIWKAYSKIHKYPQNPFRSIYACKRMPSAYPDDR